MMNEPTHRASRSIDEAIDRLAGLAVPKHQLNDSGRSDMAREVDLNESYSKPFSDLEQQEALSKLKFGKDLQILLIDSTALRIYSYFLNTHDIGKLKSSERKYIRLISYMRMENIIRYMEEKRDYTFVGEININSEGKVAPVSKVTWNIHDKKISFTDGGILFFENKSGRKEDNMIVHVKLNCHEDHGIVTFISTDEDKCIDLLEELDSFTHKQNCLKTAKIRNVNLYSAHFEIVESDKKRDTWENFYYEQSVRDLFELEVFGFLANYPRYKKRNIVRRGVLLHGEPGTGKTSLGRIICNYLYDHAVIWITPELIQTHGIESIKNIYQFARDIAPSAIILEDIDLFGDNRDVSSNSLRLGCLMNVLDGVNSVEGSVTIAMTNSVDSIEAALKNRPGRFDRKVSIGVLSDHLREKMLTDRLAEFDVEDGVFEFILDKTNKTTGAEVDEVIKSINMYFLSMSEEDSTGGHLTMEITERVLSMLGRHELKKASQAGFHTEIRNR